MPLCDWWGLALPGWAPSLRAFLLFSKLTLSTAQWCEVGVRWLVRERMREVQLSLEQRGFGALTLPTAESRPTALRTPPQLNGQLLAEGQLTNSLVTGISCLTCVTLSSYNEAGPNPVKENTRTGR